MISYELAKELKSVGFPMPIPLPDERLREAFTEDGLIYAFPTLEELIEGCNPDRFDDFGLLRNLDRWEAYVFYVGYFEFPDRFRQEDGTNLVDLHCYAETLEEAVARLYIALNDEK